MVDDEKIISALLQNPDVKRAAQSLEITPQCIYNRLRDSVFRAEYSAARGRVLEQACYTLQGFIADAVETLHTVCVDAENSPQIRVNSADALLRHCYRLTEIVDFETRIQALERAQVEGKNEQRNEIL